MTLSLTSTMPYPGTGPVPPDSVFSLPPFPPWPPSGARTLELEGILEVVQLEWRPTEFINTSLGLSLLLRPCILSSPLHHLPLPLLQTHLHTLQYRHQKQLLRPRSCALCSQGAPAQSLTPSSSRPGCREGPGACSFAEEAGR